MNLKSHGLRLKEKISHSIYNMSFFNSQPKNQSAVHLVCSRPTSHALQILRALLAVTPRSIRTNPDVVSECFSVWNMDPWFWEYSIVRLSRSICSINANRMICIEMKLIAFCVYGIYICIMIRSKHQCVQKLFGRHTFIVSYLW